LVIRPLFVQEKTYCILDDRHTVVAECQLYTHAYELVLVANAAQSFLDEMSNYDDTPKSLDHP
jgi:hypothetical protein